MFRQQICQREAGLSARYFHGGKAGLRVGYQIVPSPPHVEDGCPICVARAAGRTLTVGEWRLWLAGQGPRARALAAQLVNVPDDAPVDPPSAQKAVYVTTDELYARWYAARSGNGDLYEVTPIGELTPSPEDHFPTWTCQAAKIVAVRKRNVRLTYEQRRDLLHRWKEADEAAALQLQATP